MAATQLPAVRAVHMDPYPADQLIEALGRLAAQSGTEKPAVVLHIADGELLCDIGLSAPQVAALIESIDRQTRPPQRPWARRRP